MQRQDHHRHLRPNSFRCSLTSIYGVKEQRKLGWGYWVLEGGVVELHYVGVVLRPALQAAGEVYVDYVEAA